MPTASNRLLAVTPGLSLDCLTRMAFSRLVRFSGSAPGPFPNSSRVPRRIAISTSSSLFSRRCRSTSASSAFRRAWSSSTFLCIDANASAGPAASDEFGTAGRAPAGFPALATAFPLSVSDTGSSLDFASICRFQFLTTAA